MIFGTGAFVVLEKLANTLSVIANNLPKKQGDSYSIRRALSLRLRRWICDHSNNRRRHIPGCPVAAARCWEVSTLGLSQSLLAFLMFENCQKPGVIRNQLPPGAKAAKVPEFPTN